MAVSQKAQTAGNVTNAVTGAVASSIFTAAAASNAIPIAGQFAAAGLALAGLLTKIFVGRKQKKKKEAAEAEEKRMDQMKTSFTAQGGGGGGIGLSGGQSQQSTAPVARPQAPSFSSWGGGSAPSMQPSQQALNNSIGLK